MTSTEFKELGRGNIVINKHSGVAFVVVNDRKWYAKDAPEDDITPIQIVPMTDTMIVTLDMVADYLKG